MPRTGWIAGLTVALGVAALLAPFASQAPDGLDRVAERLGFHARVRPDRTLPAPMPEYRIGMIRNGRTSTAVAGMLGTLLVFGAAAGAGALLRRKKSS